MPTGRVLYAGLRLLDRQLIDRSGRRCGKVDDLELEPGEDGTLYVKAILTGPGALLERTGATALGSWVRHHLAGTTPEDTNRHRIPLGYVADIGNHVTLSLERDEVATFDGERWVRDHVVGHLPGSGLRARR